MLTARSGQQAAGSESRRQPPAASRPLSMALAAALAVLSAGVSGHDAPRQAAASPTVPGWAEAARFHKERVGQAGIVGGSVFLVRDGAVVAHQQVGFQDLDAKGPVDANTIFHWASITKTFTGIAIMQLRDRGRLSLDDPIVKYVPELIGGHNPFGAMPRLPSGS